MARPSQLDAALDGMCESPHEFPARWAALLTMYLDESMEQDDGYVVIAGFLGKKTAWINCGRRWRAALGGRARLHMRELRGWNDDRNKGLLERLGRIPELSGLKLIYCTVKVSDYKDLVSDTIVEFGNDGYMTALRSLVVTLMKSLPEGQRLEIICETQIAFATRREYTLKMLSELPEYLDKNGYSRLAKWSSVPKSTLLEPCDYAAYALLQRLRDPASRKAILCSPILQSKALGLPLSRQHVRKLFLTMKEVIPHAFEHLDKDGQRLFHKELASIIKPS